VWWLESRQVAAVCRVSSGTTESRCCSVLLRALARTVKRAHSQARLMFFGLRQGFSRSAALVRLCCLQKQLTERLWSSRERH
jgi:hypothetical protein